MGCFALRNLRRWDLSAALLEEREDVCTGVSRANTAIVYAGYDNKPGTLKAEMTVKANAGFNVLCQTLEVPFSRCGSLMVSFGEEADRVLLKKWEQGRQSGVPGLRLLTGEEARELEPALAPGVRSALYSPTTGTVNPWELGIAAYENAVENGAAVRLNTRVLSIRRDGPGYVIETDQGEFGCRAVLNCAGLTADKVQELLFPPSVRIFPTAADYLILERGTFHSPRHIIQHEPEGREKGLTAVPTVEGSLLLGPSEREAGEPFATSREGLEQVRQLAGQVLPKLDLGGVIRSFAAVRPNPHELSFKNGELVPSFKSINSFVIEHPGPGFWSLIGIKTPGLTCADQLGKYLADQAAEYLNAGKNGDFRENRKAIERARGLRFQERQALVEADADYGEILCHCEDITKAEIIEAIRRGAVTVDGVKRRTGATMGYCQGSRCQQKIVELLARELGIPESAVQKDGPGTRILGGRIDETM